MSVIERITNFGSAEHSFLSNFYQGAPIKLNGIIYPTSEHLYQAAKSTNIDDWISISKLSTPGQAKRAAQKLPMRDNWEEIKVQVMRETLALKFNQNRRLVTLLLNTGDAELIEGNTWGDTFWGVCDGKGINMLGKLLMELREEWRKIDDR